MYDKDLEAYLKDLDALKKKVTRNKKSAIEFLVGAGIIYKNGKLRAPYKGLSIQKK